MGIYLGAFSASVAGMAGDKMCTIAHSAPEKVFYDRFPIPKLGVLEEGLQSSSKVTVLVGLAPSVPEFWVEMVLPNWDNTRPVALSVTRSFIVGTTRQNR